MSNFERILHGRRFQFSHDYSQSYKEDLTVTSTLKHFINSKKGSKGFFCREIQKNCEL